MLPLSIVCMEQKNSVHCMYGVYDLRFNSLGKRSVGRAGGLSCAADAKRGFGHDEEPGGLNRISTTFTFSKVGMVNLVQAVLKRGEFSFGFMQGCLIQFLGLHFFHAGEASKGVVRAHRFGKFS